MRETFCGFYGILLAVNVLPLEVFLHDEIYYTTWFQLASYKFGIIDTIVSWTVLLFKVAPMMVAVAGSYPNV